MELKKKYKEDLLDIIYKHIPKCKIYLFGSRATKKEKEGSDIDLAIDAGKQIDLKTIFRIQSDIEDTDIPLFVDVVDMQTVSENFKKSVLLEGIEWKR